MKDLLVFASKDVGFACVKNIYETVGSIELLVVAESDTDIYDFAAKHDIKTKFYNEKLQDEIVRDCGQYNWLVNLWSSHILSDSILSKAMHSLNVHPSLVPFCRGNDNAAWTIRTQSPGGVSIIEMTQVVDGGDVYCQRKVDYKFPETGKAYHERLKRELISLFQASWESIYMEEIQPQRQIGEISSYKRNQTNTDRVRAGGAKFLDLEEVINWVLAHDFSPGTKAEVIVDGEVYELSLKIKKKVR
ncbi:formyltransferase family protein [Lentisphaera marina]|uniref:formyltransferase family protein n=1 Tax=Lentisphaera marina TaxID=1111041 RepID=UPI0023659DD3|nr:formyltransferase family protein [Lentisphaera marina]MDD7985728.1 formyltransferase family protein [Lentisphaera marina]